MSKQVEMIRELSDNELDVVSGAKGKESDAGRYTVSDWGPFAFAYDNKSADWAMCFRGAYGASVNFLDLGHGIEVVNR